jgi:hypothetical protein
MLICGVRTSQCIDSASVTGSAGPCSVLTSAIGPASPLISVETIAITRPSGVMEAWKKLRSCGPKKWKVPVPSGWVANKGKRFMVPKCSQRVYMTRPSGSRSGSKSSLWL